MQRSKQEMLNLILETAKNDDRVRAVIMNGSRTNPNAKKDPFQDYDIVYIVTDVESFTSDHSWIDIFGEMMILQMPDLFNDPVPTGDDPFAYLMQFLDGNRIDLTLFSVNQIANMHRDSLSLLLLDKDNLIEPFPISDESDYLPKPPTAKEFANCSNEFWWVSVYVAKGLWRQQFTYAKSTYQVVHGELMKMITWYVGMKTEFKQNLGGYGKHLQTYLEPELWIQLEKTYVGADYDNTWDALFMMCDLFRHIAKAVATEFDFNYPDDEDRKITAHLKHVRSLPEDAIMIY